jgi:hypothetical protein
MSMIGYALTLSTADLDRAAADPDWAREHVEELEAADDDSRLLDLDKAWAAIAFTLEHAQFPVNVVHGEQPLAGDEDWGYGPPRVVAPGRVREAAAAFAATTPEALLASVSAEGLDAAGVYPSGWLDEPGLLQEYVLPSLRDLTAHYASAAADGHAVVVWIG